MADTCYLCTIGVTYPPLQNRAAGEGFGTCNTCWVHACPKHGERNSQVFRCSDCVGARLANAGLIGTGVAGDADPDFAPRLAALATWVHDGIDANRMRDTISWVRRRIATRRPLSLAVDLSGGYAEIAPAELLGLDDEDVGEAAIVPASLQAEALEAQVQAAVLTAEPPEDEVRSDDVMLARLGMAIAYDARGVEDPTRSPLTFRGGLVLPASVVVLGHAYARGYDRFQEAEMKADEEVEIGMGADEEELEMGMGADA